MRLRFAACLDGSLPLARGDLDGVYNEEPISGCYAIFDYELVFLNQKPILMAKSNFKIPYLSRGNNLDILLAIDVYKKDSDFEYYPSWTNYRQVSKYENRAYH